MRNYIICFVVTFCVTNHFVTSHLAGTFYIINRSLRVFMWFWGTASNFVNTYSYASLISRLSSVFVFPEKGHLMCPQRLEFK